jgi:hypothetical protein
MKEITKTTMALEVNVGTILIKNGALLPDDLRFDTEPGVKGWSIVKDFDARGVDREIQRAGWTFFCLAGETKATTFGIDKQRMARTAIERILAKSTAGEFNSLEITRIDSVGSERFPLIHYVTVSAQSRHIQESLFLGRMTAHLAVETKKVAPGAEAPDILSDKKSAPREPLKNPRAVSA